VGIGTREKDLGSPKRGTKEGVRGDVFTKRGNHATTNIGSGESNAQSLKVTTRRREGTLKTTTMELFISGQIESFKARNSEKKDRNPKEK